MFKKCCRFIWLATPLNLRWQALFTFLLTISTIAALLFQPILIARLIQNLSTGALNSADMTSMLLMLAGAMFAGALFSRCQTYFNNILLQNTRYKTKEILYADILNRDMAFFRDRNEGWIETALATASQAARSIVYDSLTALSRIFIFIILCTGLLIFTAPVFGLLFLAAALLYLYFSYRLARNISGLVQDSVKSTAAAAARGSDVLSNIEQVRLTNMQEEELAHIDFLLKKEKTRYQAVQAKMDCSDFLQKAYLILLFSFFVLATARIAGGDPAAAVLFYIIGLMAYGQLESTGTILNGLFEMAHKLNSVLDALDYPQQPNATPHYPRRDGQSSFPSQLPEAAKGEINLSRVTFGYAGHKLLIADKTLSVKAGDHIMITGSSGIGKSTLLKLMAGVLMPVSGQIILGGIPTCAMSNAQRAEILTFVSQYAGLFDRSLFENTVYSCHNSAPEQAHYVLSALGLQDLQTRKRRETDSGADIKEIPEDGRLNRRIHKNGLGLSGGERQRVLLARAILRNRPVMILDEATSALDADTEKKVFSVLHELCAGATIIAVSHHPHSAMAGYQSISIDRTGA